jgi:hypothetical protein
MAAPAVVREVMRMVSVPDNACRILVVEDDPDTRQLACELLAALGHAASGTGWAEHALMQLEEHEVEACAAARNWHRRCWRSHGGSRSRRAP